MEQIIKRDKVFIVAEAGVNHNGSVDLALKMIDHAAAAGADAVKFQTFKAERLVSKNAPKAEYQKMTTGHNESQLEMIKRLELDYDAHKKLADRCLRKQIVFMSAPFDLESIELLQRLDMQIFKIPSGEITNLPYLQKIGRLGKEVVMSSGMADLEEVKTALQVLVSSGTPRENITILHCNTEYPTPFEDVNLKAMQSMAKLLDVRTGYSDHTLGIEVSIAAVALGASVIEKHFTIDKNMDGPDHRASLNPRELAAMVQGIRNIELALGNGQKRTSASEMKNRLVVRKSIVAAHPIKKGEIFTVENITTKRPGTGISPMEINSVIGKQAIRDFAEDEVIVL